MPVYKRASLVTNAGTTRYSYDANQRLSQVPKPDETTVSFAYEPTIWEAFTNGWHNPYLYDGLDGVRYDGEMGLYWMSMRAYEQLGWKYCHRILSGRTVFPEGVELSGGCLCSLIR
jgi:hypothetical protein